MLSKTYDMDKQASVGVVCGIWSLLRCTLSKQACLTFALQPAVWCWKKKFVWHDEAGCC